MMSAGDKRRMGLKYPRPCINSAGAFFAPYSRRGMCRSRLPRIISSAAERRGGDFSRPEAPVTGGRASAGIIKAG